MVATTAEDKKKKKIGYTPKEGFSPRGFVIRLYPTKDQEIALESLMRDARTAWNWLCKQTEDALEASVAYAVRNNLVGPRPTPPDYDTIEPRWSPDEPVIDEAKARKQAHAAAAKLAKKAYIDACKKWRHDVYLATKALPECKLRKFSEQLEHFGCVYDYHLLSKVVAWRYEESEDDRPVKPGSAFFQALTKNFFAKVDGQRRKKFRRASDPMPLQVRSGDCFELGEFGGRGKNDKFYNCRVKFNGLKIVGRLPGRAPMGRILEGVSIRKEADGWWASIKVELPDRQIPTPIPGTKIGIDVGLIDMLAFSEPVAGIRTVPNPRTKEFAERIAGIQALADKSGDTEKQKSARKRVGRLHQRMDRRVTHTLHNVLGYLEPYETIVIEDLNPKIGQMGGGSHISVMRKVRTMLIARYGEDRVREVVPHFTSQDCSQCGFRSKESWSCENGRVGECPQCGYREHRDVNAARNIAAKAA